MRELAPGGIGTSCTDLATKGGVLGSALPAAAVRLHCGLWVSFWHPVRTRSSLSANRVELSQREVRAEELERNAFHNFRSGQGERAIWRLAVCFT